MKKKYFSLALIMAIVAIPLTGAFIIISKKTKAMESTSPNGFAVVELFTSEGCSSCPSADETVARLVAKNTKNVYVLAYHVDYWNRLGWKDPFSSATYSQRQSQYASVFSLNSVYTPQIIVNGSSQFVGSDENKLTTTVQKSLLKEESGHFTIDPTKSDKLVTINYVVDGNEAVLLNLALVQPQATTSVKRGENGGKTLHHVNVVRKLKTIDAKGKGSVTMEVPDELTGTFLQLIAYTQDKKTFKILGAEQRSL